MYNSQIVDARRDGKSMIPEINRIEQLNSECGSPFYIFNEKEFIENYKNLENAFKTIYSNYQISYSFKTNYTPYVCRLIKNLGGYAEVVSKMEYKLAKIIGYDDSKIIFNGPCKEIYPDCILNVDSLDELRNTVNKRIGLRINIDVGQGFVSRFGIDTENLDEAFEIAGNRIVGIHCHVSQARSLTSWKQRTEVMLAIADRYFGSGGPEYIDLGSGMYADMPYELKAQFDNVPTYTDYADIVAGKFAEHYKNRRKPILFTEPGTTLVNRYFDFICKVESIKHIKGKCFVVLNGSKHNLGEICELKELPVKVLHIGADSQKLKNAKLCGYTCLEHDILRKNFDGDLAIGDLIIFKNVGGYSLVSKPPFIRPNYPVYTEKGKRIKRQETFKEVFETYE